MGEGRAIRAALWQSALDHCELTLYVAAWARVLHQQRWFLLRPRVLTAGRRGRARSIEALELVAAWAQSVEAGHYSGQLRDILYHCYLQGGNAGEIFARLLRRRILRGMRRLFLSGMSNSGS